MLIVIMRKKKCDFNYCMLTLFIKLPCSGHKLNYNLSILLYCPVMCLLLLLILHCPFFFKRVIKMEVVLGFLEKHAICQHVTEKKNLVWKQKEIMATWNVILTWTNFGSWSVEMGQERTMWCIYKCHPTIFWLTCYIVASIFT